MSEDRMLSSTQVMRAFADAGLRRPPLFRLFNSSQDGVSEEHWDSDPSSRSPSVVVEVFSSLHAARLAVAVGGNEETTKGVQIPPIARVGNVVVTLYADATRDERARTLRAVASLRKLSG
jgi:hypothetical protein